MRVIIITGSVCAGKTTLAKKICKKTGYAYGDVNLVIKRNHLRERFDAERRCFVVDEARLSKALLREIAAFRQKKAKGIIFDSHMAQCLPRRSVDLCIVARCGLKELAQRMKQRKYHQEKIRENLECEIFEVCLGEALARKYAVVKVDTTKGIKSSIISRLARKCLLLKENHCWMMIEGELM
ncbi:AAA family ATPase [Candidatus Woesearchaeota archaeon]|nr:AAA family ATPase [Candidatus Woesearchaeota archaeon]